MISAMEALGRQNLRRLRAQALVAAILEEVGASGVECDIPGLHDVLMGVFERNGASIMTDQDRAELGLEARDEKGWTHSELLQAQAEKRAALTAMAAPMGITAHDPKEAGDGI